MIWFLACHSAPDLLPLKIHDQTIQVEVADSSQERTMGLMYRDSLAADTGMVFVYPDSEVRQFWMKDTRIPLSIAFVDGAGIIVHIADMKPLDTRTTSSEKPAQYALEVNQGWFVDHGIKVGDRVEGLPAGAR